MKKKGAIDYSKWDKYVKDNDLDDDNVNSSENQRLLPKGEGRKLTSSTNTKDVDVNNDDVEDNEHFKEIVSALKKVSDKTQLAFTAAEIDKIAKFILVQASIEDISNKSREFEIEREGENGKKKYVQDNVYKYRLIIDVLVLERDLFLSKNVDQQMIDAGRKQENKVEELLLVCLLETAKEGIALISQRSFSMIQEALNTLIACRIYGPPMELYAAICSPKDDKSLQIRTDYATRKYVKEAMLRRMLGMPKDQPPLAGIDDDKGIFSSLPCNCVIL